MVLAGRQAEPARHPVFIDVALTEPDKVISQGVDVFVVVVLVVARPRRQSVERPRATCHLETAKHVSSASGGDKGRRPTRWMVCRTATPVKSAIFTVLSGDFHPCGRRGRQPEFQCPNDRVPLPSFP